MWKSRMMFLNNNKTRDLRNNNLKNQIVEKVIHCLNRIQCRQTIFQWML